eukprot:763959-Hanusia_phi.AAC.11
MTPSAHPTPQVMVAVLLENFFGATRQDREECARAAAQQMRAADAFPLDIILQRLQYDNTDDLQRQIARLFDLLDVDRTGSISYSELADGLHKLDPSSHLKFTEDDFDRLTQGRKLCNDDWELGFPEFCSIIIAQLRMYTMRKVTDAIMHLESSVEIEVLLSAVKELMINIERMDDNIRTRSHSPARDSGGFEVSWSEPPDMAANAAMQQSQMLRRIEQKIQDEMSGIRSMIKESISELRSEFLQVAPASSRGMSISSKPTPTVEFIETELSFKIRDLEVEYDMQKRGREDSPIA